MPLGKLGYQPWEKKNFQSSRRTPLAMIYWGVRLTLPRFWTQVMLLFLWLSAIVFLFLSLVDYFVVAIDFVNVRDFMHWQQRGVVFFVAIMGAGLISSDVEGNSFILYFSRPLKIHQYILGKLGILTFYFLLMIFSPTAVLILLEYILEAETAFQSWKEVGIALGCSLAYTVVIVLSLGIMTLGVSALSKSRKGASFLWMSLYFVSEALYQFLSLGLERFSELNQWLKLVSYRQNIELLGIWIFSPFVRHAEPPGLAWYWPLLILTLISLLSWWAVVHRIRSRIA